MTTYDFVAANKRKTVILIAVFGAVVLGIGYLFDRVYDAGGTFIVFAAIYSAIMALVSYYAGDRVALASSAARPVTEAQSPRLVRMVQNLSITTGTPMPAVYVMSDPAINAFATGRDPQHASIAVTTGALDKLTDTELEGVLAHELSHVKNYDILVMTIVIVLVGIVGVLANWFFRMSWFNGRRRSDDRDGGNGLLIVIGLVLMLFAPIIAQLIRLAVSRKREFLADASGVLVTRYPQGLKDALRKIQTESLPMQRASAATAHLFIANPFSGQSIAKLFSTHPPIEERIAALDRMDGVS